MDTSISFLSLQLSLYGQLSTLGVFVKFSLEVLQALLQRASEDTSGLRRGRVLAGLLVLLVCRLGLLLVAPC